MAEISKNPHLLHIFRRICASGQNRMFEAEVAELKECFLRILALVPIAIAISACTTTNEIIIDERRSNMANYDRDLAECEAYSEQVPVGEKAARGAGSGAAVGGAIGAVSDRHDAGEGAGIGAITGGAAGINRGQQEKVRVVKNCLRGRGYAVLN